MSKFSKGLTCFIILADVNRDRVKTPQFLAFTIRHHSAVTIS